MSEIKHGKGVPVSRDDYIDFINYVFGFNGNSSDFNKLLPKLYKPEYDPCGSAYSVTEDGKLKAAIGVFDMNFSVAGEALACRGIGNVAVHPYCRSKGYMKLLMNEALDDMVKDGIDFAVLGGRRQRYNYFSFERAGVSHGFSLNSDNMRHCFGRERAHRFEIRQVNRGDAVVEDIKALQKTLPFRATREEHDYYDVLVSWQAKPVAAFEGGSFRGYAVVRNDTVTEILTADPADFTDLAVCLYDAVGRSTLNFALPPFQKEYIDAIYRIAEGYQTGCNEMYSVLNYKKVSAACMKLTPELPDGELVLEINGRAKTERLLFTVRGGVPSVTDTDLPPFMTLSHIDACNLLFAPLSHLRGSLPNFAKLWFPMPLWVYSADMV